VARERREALARAEARIAELEARITALRNDMSPVGLTDPNRLQTMQAEIATAQRELEAARAAAAAARQAVDDLEDDARRAGALPGWVR
jgi:predicted  nucleic acid-binding Zn-ribbon protein